MVTVNQILLHCPLNNHILLHKITHNEFSFERQNDERFTVKI